MRVTNGAPWRFHEDVIQATTPAHRSRADRGNPLVIRATDHDIFPSTGTAASSRPGNCNDAQIKGLKSGMRRGSFGLRHDQARGACCAGAWAYVSI